MLFCSIGALYLMLFFFCPGTWCLLVYACGTKESTSGVPGSGYVCCWHFGIWKLLPLDVTSLHSSDGFIHLVLLVVHDTLIFLQFQFIWKYSNRCSDALIFALILFPGGSYSWCFILWCWRNIWQNIKCKFGSLACSFFGQLLISHMNVVCVLHHPTFFTADILAFFF